MMLRQFGLRFISRPVALARVSSRPFSTDDTPASGNTIVSNSVRPPRQSHSSFPPKLTVRLYIRQSQRRPIQVDMVTVPAMTGQMSIWPGHLPTMTELKAGLLTVHEGDEVTKYFISSGFAIVHLNSYTDILAGEVVMLEWVDPDKVQMGLTHFTQLLNCAPDDRTKAEAQIGVDVYTALTSALFG